MSDYYDEHEYGEQHASTFTKSFLRKAYNDGVERGINLGGIERKRIRADERERIAQSFDREAEWRESNHQDEARIFRAWAREIRESGEIADNTK